MCDGYQDVALSVVNPSLPSRLSPPTSCASTPDHASLPANQCTRAAAVRNSPPECKTSSNDTSDATDCGSVRESQLGQSVQKTPNEKTSNTFDDISVRETYLENDVQKTPREYTNNITYSGDKHETQFENPVLETYDYDIDRNQVSTDDTVINSASDNDILKVSSSEENWTALTTHEIMGNQSGKKKKGDEDDDETRTKCCEIPKKKLKDRNSKISKSSRSEDNDFDDDEVYPFDSRTRTSEQDDHDTVELEPFEIIETDDIKFIAGAGTSDVIRNASDSKFKAIPEEACVDEDDEELRLFEQAEETILNEASASIDKGARIPESGTSTAHSTFEFRQVKKKGKLKALREESQTVYENVDMGYSADSEKPRPVLTGEAARSSGSSKSNSSSSSKSSSRKNSKDAIPKPARNSKKKAIENENKNVPYVNAEVSESKVEKSEVKLNETPKSSNAVILTQTMFSKPKKESDNPDSKASLESQSQNTYENVNLCAIMTPTGIVIGHKKAEGGHVAGNVIRAAERPKSLIETPKPPVGVPKGDDLSASTSASALHGTDKSFKSLPSPSKKPPQIEPAIYETLNSPSYDDKMTQDKQEINPPDTKEPVYSEPNISELPKRPEENRSRNSDSNVLQVEGKDECVPPPSPQGMEILAEEEEDEEDEEEDDDIDTEQTNRKSAEIVDFTENVCKRLSQLLETMPQDDEQPDEEDLDDKTDSDKYNHALHIYEEVLDKFEKKEDRKETVTKSETPDLTSSIDRLDPLSNLHRNDSSNTLKRTSGDSNTYPMTEFLGSSDDDLPEYFDPRNDDEFVTSTTKVDKSVPISVSKDSGDRPKPSQRDDYVDMSGWKPSYIDSPSAKSREGILGHNLSQSISESESSHVTNLQERKPNAGQAREFSSLTELPILAKHADVVEAASPGPASHVTALQDLTPTAEASQELSALAEYASVDESAPLYHTYGRHSVTYTESDLDISEHRDDLSTDSMLADDEDEETMEILFTKTYTEPQDGGEVFLSCTVVNSAYKEDTKKKSDTWLSDDALQYFEANAAEVMSTAFMRARKEMKDIQICIQNLRHQMEHFHGDCDDVSLPDMTMDSLSPDYFPRKAVTD